MRIAKLRYLVLLVSFLAMVSCKADMAILVYVNDILDLLSAKSGTIQTKATVQIEIPSQDSAEQILTVLQRYFKSVDNTKTISKDMSTFLSFTTTFPLTYLGPGGGDRTSDDMVLLILLDTEESGPILEIALNKNQLANLNTYIKDQYYQSITVEEMSFSITINNDTRNDFKVRAQAAYLNDKPSPFLRELVLKKREDLNIRFSDVLRDSLKDDEETPVAQFPPK